MTGDILVTNVDFELLYAQRNALLPMESDDMICGIINLLESILDKAEEEGYFKFPMDEEE